MKEIPLLQADDIEVRVQSVTKDGSGATLLIYKDARVDMRILDDVFGPMGWQRTHETINNNLFCNIDVWDEVKQCWIRKQDVGSESATAKEKGEASDSFKRAGTNVGIGRELYTAPFIYVKLNANEVDEYQGKKRIKNYVEFMVKDIGYNDRREINRLVITDGNGKKRFEMGKRIEEPAEPPKEPEPPKPKPKVIHVDGTTKLLTQKGYVSIATIDKETLQKMYDSGFYREANAEIEKVLGGSLSKHDLEALEAI